MARALELARKGRFGAHPNPMVGAVVVRTGEIVGEGFHESYGGPHAEVSALKNAAEKARGADLYVTLEPCRHYGKTPPCTRGVIEAGISRVYIGTADPNIKVSGGGAEELRKAGIEVHLGMLEEPCRELIRTFTKRVTTGMPWVTLKSAVSLDGKVATRTGASKWITSEPARKLVHEKRAEVDGILTGLGTVLADDPMLDVRMDDAEVRSPHRIILDPEAQLPHGSRLAKTAGQFPTTLVVSEQVPPDVTNPLEDLGVQILRMPYEAGTFDWQTLLSWCGQQPMNEILIESGPILAGSAFDHRVINSVMFFIAPKLIGGSSAPVALGGHGIETLSQAARLINWRMKEVPPDLLIEADVVYPWCADPKGFGNP